MHMFIETQVTTEKSHLSHVNWDKHLKLIRTRLKPNISIKTKVKEMQKLTLETV